MYPPIELEPQLPEQDDLSVLQESQGPTPEEIEAENARLEAEREADEKETDDLLRELIVNHAEKEDVDLRLTPLNMWRRNTLYFNNIQNIFLDPVAQDYRTINSLLAELTKEGSNVDIKIINVYRAYIESIVSALSVEVPTIEFPPDDADNPDDVETAKAYGSIGIIIQKRNHAALMAIKALTILCNQGTVFGYNYNDVDPKYGYYQSPKETVQKETPVQDLRCAECGELIDSNMSMEVQAEGSVIKCPSCGYTGKPDVYQKLIYVDEVVSWENTPKGKTRFSIYGPTEVKAPLYAKAAEDVGYLILRREDHIARFKTKYKNYDLTDKNDSESYERWARLPIEYYSVVPQHIATLRECWFRPWYFNELDEDGAEKLLNKYPDGVKVCIVGDDIVEKKVSNLDESWTISIDPRSDHLHAEPLGNVIVPIQDAENDVFNLGLQSIEYGVPETFVHPKTLNLQKYAESNAAPGMMSPAMPYAPDKSIGDGFHTIKASTLSSEYTAFEKGLETKGQFTSGAMASIFGGTTAAGSRTADEYRQSRAQALQRLTIPQRSFDVFWTDLIYKSVQDYAKNLREDDRYTEKNGGNFINIVITKSSLTGKVGQITPDMNKQLPQSWAQKRDFIATMIEKAPEMTGTILMHPNNADILKNFTGIPEIYIPGENDVQKQNREFYELINGTQVSEIDSSVPIDIHVDDHAVHKLVLKDLLVSPVGLALSPEAYANCILHYIAHDKAEQAKTMAMAGKTGPNEPVKSAIDSNEGV